MMWLRDFHIDGLRLDAVHAIKDFSAKHFLEELRENTDKLNEVSAVSHFLIAESDLNDPRLINPVEKGGYGLDLQWCDEFHHALHALVTGEEYGYYSDFGSIDTSDARLLMMFLCMMALILSIAKGPLEIKYRIFLVPNLWFLPRITIRLETVCLENVWHHSSIMKL